MIGLGGPANTLLSSRFCRRSSPPGIIIDKTTPANTTTSVPLRIALVPSLCTGYRTSRRNREAYWLHWPTTPIHMHGMPGLPTQQLPDPPLLHPLSRHQPSDVQPATLISVPVMPLLTKNNASIPASKPIFKTRFTFMSFAPFLPSVLYPHMRRAVVIRPRFTSVGTLRRRSTPSEHRLVRNSCVVGDLPPPTGVELAAPNSSHDAAVIHCYDVGDSAQTELVVRPMRGVPQNVTERQMLLPAVAPRCHFQVLANPDDSPRAARSQCLREPPVAGRICAGVRAVGGESNN